MLELVVVLAVIGLMLGVALPKFRRVSALYDLDRTSRQFAADLRLAQSEALRRNRNVTATYLSAASYKVAFTRAGVEEIVRQRSFPSGTTFSAAWSAVTFRPYGAPTGTTLPLAVTIASAVGSRRIDIGAGGVVSVP